jgi:hypothetical protein
MRKKIIHSGCSMCSGTNSAGRGEDDQAEKDRFGGRRADVAEHDLEVRNRRGEQFVDRAVEFREEDAERGVGNAVREEREHDQPRHDEGAVADAVDLVDARTDGRAEDDEIERGGNHRRDDALQERAPGSCHFEAVDGEDGREVHAFFLHQADEDVFQRTLARLQIVEADAARLMSSSSGTMPLSSSFAS